MLRAAALLLLGLTAACAPLRADASAAAPQGRLPETRAMLGSSVLDALIAAGRSELSGVFAFVPAEAAPMAMADLLMHDPKALKGFVKKGERDRKKYGGIDGWDKQVYLYLVGLSRQLVLPAGMKKPSERWMGRINELALAPPLRYDEMRAADRGGK